MVFGRSKEDIRAGGQAYQDLREGKVPLLVGVSVLFKNAISALVAPNPLDRPTPEKLLALPIFAKKAAAKETDALPKHGGLNLQPVNRR